MLNNSRADALVEAKQQWPLLPVETTDTGLEIGGQQVVQYWERPLMERMGKAVSVNGGHVLEIGFGLGMSANVILASGCTSYTVIEAHPEIANRARKLLSRTDIPHTTVIEGFWEDVIRDLPSESFDGILFDTCPISETQRDIWYRAFNDFAPRFLKPGGIYTYFSNQDGDGPLREWPSLAKDFSSIIVEEVPVNPSSNCDYWRSSTILMPILKK